MNLYTHISEVILAFEKGILPFHALTSELDASIESISEEWEQQKRALRAEWWTLEQVNAAMLGNGEKDIQPTQRQMVIDALGSIRRLVNNITSRDNRLNEQDQGQQPMMKPPGLPM